MNRLDRIERAMRWRQIHGLNAAPHIDLSDIKHLLNVARAAERECKNEGPEYQLETALAPLLEEVK